MTTAKRRPLAEGLRALGYGRVSTYDQAVNGVGLQAQASSIQAECRRRGWKLLEIIDDDASGKSLKRPGVQRALEMLKTRKADVLIVAKLDRLSRSLVDYASVVERAQREGWQLIVLDAPVGTDTPYGEALMGMLAVFAQLERRLIGARTKEALAVKKAAGVRLGRTSTLPAEVVDRIRKAKAEGRSLSGIAADLNADGVPTGQGGKQWYASSVAAVLRSGR